MISSIIVENTRKDSDRLKRLLDENFAEIEVKAICQTVEQAVAKINIHKPQLLFLDVELDSPTTGFDVLEQSPDIAYSVIFTTSYEKYAIRAIEFSALFYIVKPVNVDTLSNAIDKFKNVQLELQRERIESFKKNLKQPEINSIEIFIPFKGGKEKTTLGEILYCTTGGNGIFFQLTNKEIIITSWTLDYVIEQLKECHFCRIHDSRVINLHHVKKYTHVRDGADVLLTNGENVEVSKRRKADFISAIEKLNIIKNS